MVGNLFLGGCLLLSLLALAVALWPGPRQQTAVPTKPRDAGTVGCLKTPFDADDQPSRLKR